MKKYVISCTVTGSIFAKNGALIDMDTDTPAVVALFDSYQSAEMWLKQTTKAETLQDEDGDDRYTIALETIYVGYLHTDGVTGMEMEDVICSDLDYFITSKPFSDNAIVASGKYVSFSGDAFIFVPAVAV